MSTDNTELRKQLEVFWRDNHLSQEENFMPKLWPDQFADKMLELIARHTDEADRLQPILNNVARHGKTMFMIDGVSYEIDRLKPTKTPEDKEGENE